MTTVTHCIETKDNGRRSKSDTWITAAEPFENSVDDSDDSDDDGSAARVDYFCNRLILATSRL